MTDDPIVQEVRAAREAFAREHGFDLRRMAAALKAMNDADTTRRVVRLPPRPVGANAAELPAPTQPAAPEETPAAGAVA